MKPKIILKSLAELPVNTFALAASGTDRALHATRQVLSVPARATRREMRVAQQQSVAFVQNLMRRANAPFCVIQPWPCGGLND